LDDVREPLLFEILVERAMRRGGVNIVRSGVVASIS
jgi:hypothetical protein